MNNQIACFASTSKIVIFNDLFSYEVDCENSFMMGNNTLSEGLHNLKYNQPIDGYFPAKKKLIDALA